jgi:predicted nucleic acid-binding protein
MINVFTDTNVLVYGIDQKSKFNKASSDILNNKDNNLFVTTKNISEYFSVCTKLQIEKDVIWGFYNDIKENITILFPDTKSLSFFETLIKKYNPIGNQVYDIEIVSVMLANKIKKLATFNEKDFKNIEEVELHN